MDKKILVFPNLGLNFHFLSRCFTILSLQITTYKSQLLKHTHTIRVKLSSGGYMPEIWPELISMLLLNVCKQLLHSRDGLPRILV